MFSPLLLYHSVFAPWLELANLLMYKRSGGDYAGRLTELRYYHTAKFNSAPLLHDLLGNRLQDGRYLYQWDTLNRLVGMQAYQQSGQFKVVGDSWRFGYRADGLRVFKEKVSQAIALEGTGNVQRTEYLYDGQMPVMEQDFEGGVSKQSRVHLLGARGIEAVMTIDHARGNQVAFRWLLYDGHGNLVRTMTPEYALSDWQWRGVWGERTEATAGRATART